MHIDDALPMMLVDTTFASLVTLAAHGIGAPVTPIRVELARRRADERMLRQAFGCPIHFDAPLATKSCGTCLAFMYFSIAEFEGVPSELKIKRTASLSTSLRACSTAFGGL